MKKILLVLVAVLCVATVSAKKSFAEVMSSQKWTAGLRVGSGLQVDASWAYSDKSYVEARFGMSWLADSEVVGAGNTLTADFTVLHNWNICNWDWTPSVGKWFLDTGCGLNIGGRPLSTGGGASGGGASDGGYEGDWGWGRAITRAGGSGGSDISYYYVGAVAHVKFGIKFNKVPIRLAVDWTPVILGTEYTKAKGQKKAGGQYFANGWANFGVSAVWCF